MLDLVIILGRVVLGIMVRRMGGMMAMTVLEGTVHQMMDTVEDMMDMTVPVDMGAMGMAVMGMAVILADTVVTTGMAATGTVLVQVDLTILPMDLKDLLTGQVNLLLTGLLLLTSLLTGLLLLLPLLTVLMILLMGLKDPLPTVLPTVLPITIPGTGNVDIIRTGMLFMILTEG
jgi:hypothetical protein